MKKKNAQPRNAELSAHNFSANPTITTRTTIVLTGLDIPRVDSRLLAQHMEVKHRSTFKLITEHQQDFEAFGQVRFQIAAVAETGARGVKHHRFALLNEDQAYLLLTYSRNTATVRALKVKLVKAFSAARKAAEQRQTEYLPSYHLAHDSLKGLAPDPQRQHYLHMNVNKLLNKVAGIGPGKRGTAQQGSLVLLTVGQMLAAQAVAGAVDHKAAYERIKTAMQSLQTLLQVKAEVAA